MLRIKEGSAGHWAIRSVWLAAVVAVVLYVPTSLSAGAIGDVTVALELVLCAMALNLVFGYAGQISLGHSAFFGIGSYTTAVLVIEYGWDPILTFVVGIAIAFVVGCLVGLPAVRVQGVYLAVVTLAVAVLFPALMRWQKLEWLTSGARGIDSIRYEDLPVLPLLGELRGREGRAVFSYWLAIVAVVAGYLVCRGIVRSRVGNALVAVRDNTTAAAVMGVDVTRTKMLVFGTSATLASVAGSLAALRSSTVTPDGLFLTLFGSITFLLVMIVGGPATLWGPIVGAFAYMWIDASTRDAGAAEDGLLPTLFGWMDTSPAALVLAISLLVIVFLAPDGLVGLMKRGARHLVVIESELPGGPAGSDLHGTTDRAPGADGERGGRGGPPTADESAGGIGTDGRQPTVPAGHGVVEPHGDT